ncbi:hypothetical protein GCM10022261_05030 [Brevibacterium daeguense]|uniref:STAS domain-containing protein n=1 Tax=Brevibacterium daeguense TaxID=909936 RepID=A0ABP8EG72_9MICO|nr:hypothetical protein [Brevibacterium daeguense]
MTQQDTANLKNQLQIVVHADPSSTEIAIEAEGSLTVETVGSLLRTLERAVMLIGCTGIDVDLWKLDRLDPEAWSALEGFAAAVGEHPPIRLDESCRPSNLLGASQEAQSLPREEAQRQLLGS